VNKQSLAQHYIGLHNESTFKKTATYGAFVCFNPATEGGGEFFIADGAKIFRDMKTEVLEKFYNKVRTLHDIPGAFLDSTLLALRWEMLVA
jgi:hypothetical protein